MIRHTILFDNKCGFVLGENPKAPNPYVTWQFNEQDGHRDFFWGHYHNEPDMAERDFHNRAEDYQRRYHVFEVEQAPDKETYKYYSTQRPIDIGTYPNSYFNRPVHMDLYFTRLEVTGEAFQACGAITYAQPLTEREMQDYELRPSRENLDIRRQMDAQAQVVGKWEDAHHVPEQRRLTWFYPDFGSYVAKLSAQLEAAPEAVTQYYSFFSDLQANVEKVDAAFAHYKLDTEGYIRTGIVYYDGAAPVYGVAVGQDLTCREVDGEKVVEQNNFRAVFTATRLSFWQDATEVAYVSNNRLYITNITVLGGIDVGQWSMEAAEGGLAFRWIGG